MGATLMLLVCLNALSVVFQTKRTPAAQENPINVGMATTPVTTLHGSTSTLRSPSELRETKVCRQRGLSAQEHTPEYVER